MKAPRKLMKAVVQLALGAAVITSVGLFLAFFLYFRYLPPKPAGGINQDDNIKFFQERTGLTLPMDTLILAATDGSPRDGTRGYFRWSIYLQYPISLPGEVRLLPASSRLADSANGIEKGIWPYKIKEPKTVSLHSWTHSQVDVRLTAVTGARGVYVTVQTFDRSNVTLGK